MRKIDLMRQKLETAFKPVHLRIYDESLKKMEYSGERARPETYFFVDIVSDKFMEMPRSERVRLINEALSDIFRGSKHTLEIHARSPQEQS
ncbi:MAG TPA: BolA family protein [Rickettsiales bacterium]|nr:BolA family protein [Rickettsiales bacterium]